MSSPLRARTLTVQRALCLTFLATLLVFALMAQGQTYNVLYAFHGGNDGALPAAGLTIDGRGNLYGTTSQGGGEHGGVFQLVHSGDGWSLNPLHVFEGTPDGIAPQARVIFGPDGTLYGTTVAGGTDNCVGPGCGAVFNLRPPASVCKTVLCPWTETVIYSFQGGEFDGARPYSEVTFDREGNLYGTTQEGGSLPNCVGNSYKRSTSGGEPESWDVWISFD